MLASIIAAHSGLSCQMKMLRWMCGKTWADCIRSTFIQSRLGVRHAADILQERRLIWYGHVLRWSTNYIERQCLDVLVSGVRLKLNIFKLFIKLLTVNIVWFD